MEKSSTDCNLKCIYSSCSLLFKSKKKLNTHFISYNHAFFVLNISDLQCAKFLCQFKSYNIEELKTHMKTCFNYNFKDSLCFQKPEIKEKKKILSFEIFDFYRNSDFSHFIDTFFEKGILFLSQKRKKDECRFTCPIYGCKSLFDEFNDLLLHLETYKHDFSLVLNNEKTYTRVQKIYNESNKLENGEKKPIEILKSNLNKFYQSHNIKNKFQIKYVYLHNYGLNDDCNINILFTIGKDIKLEKISKPIQTCYKYSEISNFPLPKKIFLQNVLLQKNNNITTFCDIKMTITASCLLNTQYLLICTSNETKQKNLLNFKSSESFLYILNKDLNIIDSYKISYGEVQKISYLPNNNIMFLCLFQDGKIRLFVYVDKITELKTFGFEKIIDFVVLENKSIFAIDGYNIYSCELEINDSKTIKDSQENKKDIQCTKTEDFVSCVDALNSLIVVLGLNGRIFFYDKNLQLSQKKCLYKGTDFLKCIESTDMVIFSNSFDCNTKLWPHTKNNSTETINSCSTTFLDYNNSMEMAMAYHDGSVIFYRNILKNFRKFRNIVVFRRSNEAIYIDFVNHKAYVKPEYIIFDKNLAIIGLFLSKQEFFVILRGGYIFRFDINIVH